MEGEGDGLAQKIRVAINTKVFKPTCAAIMGRYFEKFSKNGRENEEDEEDEVEESMGLEVVAE